MIFANVHQEVASCKIQLSIFDILSRRANELSNKYILNIVELIDFHPLSGFYRTFMSFKQIISRMLYKL